MDDETAVSLLDQIDDPEIREIITKSPEVREAIHQAMCYAVDSTAMNTVRGMMQDVDVADGVKKDLLLGWLDHRRKEKEVHLRLHGNGAGGEGITFNVSFATNAEVDNVKQARQVFGVDEEEKGEATDAKLGAKEE